MSAAALHRTGSSRPARETASKRTRGLRPIATDAELISTFDRAVDALFERGLIEVVIDGDRTAYAVIGGSQ